MKAAYIVWAIVACLLWSTAFAAVKLGLEDYHKPLTFAGVRFMLAGLLLIPFWKGIRPACRSMATCYRGILLTAFFNTFVLYALFFQGVNLVPGAIGAIITGASPMIAAVMGHFLMPNEKLNRRKFIAIMIGVFGLILLTLRKGYPDQPALPQLCGMLLLFLAGCSGIFGNIIVSRTSFPGAVNPLILNSVQLFLGGGGLLLTGLILEGPPELLARNVTFYLALLWLSLISSLAFSIWLNLLKQPEVKVSDLNQWKFLIPMFGAALSWLLLPDEKPAVNSLSGWR